MKKPINKTYLTARQKIKIKLLRTKIMRWGKTNNKKFIWRNSPGAYSILIAEFLLQRTKAQQAEKQYKIFLKKFPNFQKLQKAKTSELNKLLFPLGLRKRAYTLKCLIDTLAKRYGGKIPNDYKELKKLPGIGDYTASAILIFALNEVHGLVDVNVIKIFSDLFNLNLTREEEKKSEFIKNCANYYSSLGEPRVSNWYLLDYSMHKYGNSKLPKGL